MYKAAPDHKIPLAVRKGIPQARLSTQIMHNHL